VRAGQASGKVMAFGIKIKVRQVGVVPVLVRVGQPSDKVMAF
jgi:hypothetical protein